MTRGAVCELAMSHSISKTTDFNQNFFSLMSYMEKSCMLSRCGMVVINVLFQPGHKIALRFGNIIHARVDASAVPLNCVLILMRRVAEFLSDFIYLSHCLSYVRVYYTIRSTQKCKRNG